MSHSWFGAALAATAFVLAGAAGAPGASLAQAPDAAAAATTADPGEADRRAVWETEEAFAASFAARDPERFATFLAEDAVFTGARRELRGKAEIAEAWKGMMLAGPEPPFSWRPTRVLVHGDVALSTGTVHDPSGRWIGAFTSVWQRQPDGSWKIVLDGAAPCEQRAVEQAAPEATPSPSPTANPPG